ncbi:MAG: DNA methyltransferase [Steroidobacteraceae bacterium]
MEARAGRFASAEARWAGVGPYYAMFPAEFADRVIAQHTERGDTIVDPFAGRGTSLFSAATAGRHALGVEINPVGWVFAATKLAPAQSWSVLERIDELGRKAARFRNSAKATPKFFRRCFHSDVLQYLLAARSHLDWRASVVDRTLMAILLIDLHGKRDFALSNQMRQTKSMSPDYAIRWWKAEKSSPPKLDPVEFLQKKVEWRYKQGVPETCESRVYLADSTHRLAGLRATADRLAPKGARLLFTSPPYYKVTNYHYDQWLRLWLLGGPTFPRSYRSKHRGKFDNRSAYRALLLAAFTHAREVLAKDATIYVRTHRRKETARMTRDVLKAVFPKHEIARRLRPLNGLTQTRLFGHKVQEDGEVDLVLMRG